MALPILRLDQVSQGNGSDGISRDDLLINEALSITDVVPGNAAGPHVTELVGKPSGSAAGIVNSTSLTAQLTMDVDGSYLIKRTFNNDPLQVSYIVAASKENPNSWRYPAFGERREFNGSWAPALEFIFDTVQYGTLLIDGEQGDGAPDSIALLVTSIHIDEVAAPLAANNLHLQMGKGSVAPLSDSDTGRIRYNESLQQFEQSVNGGAWSALGAGGGGGPGSDTTAVHVDTANEIAPLPGPAGGLVGADVLLVEDASAGTPYSKASATIQDILNLAAAASTASSLATTGAPVNVGAAAPPAGAGEILVTTGATTATWQDPGGIDTDAIHNNVASEITALSAPAGGLDAADEFLIEDTSAADIKAKATIQDILDLVPGSGASVADLGLTGWQKVETKEITGAPASSLTFTGLDGDVDGEYLLVVHALRSVNNATVRDLIFLPNGLTTNQESLLGSMNVGNMVGAATVTQRFGFLWTADQGTFAVRCIAATTPDGTATARDRKFLSEGYIDLKSSGGATRRVLTSGGTWFDTSTNITSLEVRLAATGTTTAIAELDIGTTVTLYKRVVAGTPLVDITVAGSDVQFVDLPIDGETYESVRFEFLVQGLAAATAVTYAFQPNGTVTTNQNTQEHTLNSGVGAAAESSDMRIGRTAATPPTDMRMRITGTMNLKTGFPRFFEVRAAVKDLPADSTLMRDYVGGWNEDAAAITSMRVQADTAGAIRIGSRFRVWQRETAIVQGDASPIQYVDVDTTAPPGTQTLPASPATGQMFNYADISGNASVNNITISGNGNNVNGAATLVLTDDYDAVTLRFNGTEWIIR